MELAKEDDGEVALPSDMPWFRHNVPVLKERALEALGSVLSTDGEFLPLDCDEGQLWAFNVTTVLDALDLDHSDLIRFSSGRIMKVNSYAFRTDKLRAVSAFRIPQMSSLFVTGDVVTHAAALDGVGFRMLWEGPFQTA